MKGPLPGRRGVLAAGATCMLGAAKAAGSGTDAVFPLRVAPNRRHIEDAAGRPFFIHGDTAWSLVAQLGPEDAFLYLRDRRARGFNAILANLIEHRFARRAPRNMMGAAPFLGDVAFGVPNEAYFQHADQVLREARRLGFAVFLAPAYLGGGGGEEGWYRAMRRAGAARLRAYGAFIGQRYGGLGNIIWVHGGDYDPPDKGPTRAVAEGIRLHDSRSLHTAHGAAETSVAAVWGSERWFDLDAVYTYRPVHAAMRRAQARTPHRPRFLIEATYENEHGAAPALLRKQAWQALTGGACGHLFGNNPIWHFGTPGARNAPVTWREALAGPGTLGMVHFHSLVSRLPWWNLLPDTSQRLLVAPRGAGHDLQTAALVPDGSVGIVHVPTGDGVLLDLAAMAGGGIAARWFDPAAGRHAGVPLSWPRASGRVEIAPPRTNAGGDHDWVLEMRRHG